MAKPRIKKEVAVGIVLHGSLIEFYASRDAATEFEEFGKVVHFYDEKYTLIVDRRFDFDEVLEYIKSY
jgi:hypothetical protein